MPEKMNGSDLVSPPEEPTPTTKKINIVVLGALVAIALCIGIILSWAFTNEDVLELKDNPIPTRTIRDHPTAGGVVILDLDYCKKASVEGDLRVSFVSPSREVLLPVVKERSPEGCHHTEFPVLIPKEIIPDTYEIKLRVTYDVNPLKQNIVEEYKSMPVIIDPTVPTNDR